MEKFLHKHDKIISKDFIDLKIDTAEMLHGEEVAKRLRKSRTGGIPWMVILDGNGKELISSDGPKGNCGYPYLPHEIEHFIKMLKATSTKTTPQQLAVLKKALNDYREEKEKKKN